jgi:hypothetical protein
MKILDPEHTNTASIRVPTLSSGQLGKTIKQAKEYKV